MKHEQLTQTAKLTMFSILDYIDPLSALHS